MFSITFLCDYLGQLFKYLSPFLQAYNKCIGIKKVWKKPQNPKKPPDLNNAKLINFLPGQ